MSRVVTKVSKSFSSFGPKNHPNTKALFIFSLLPKTLVSVRTRRVRARKSHGFCRWCARRVLFPSARSSSRERGPGFPSQDGDERKHPIERGKVPRRVPGKVHKNGIYSSGVSRDGGSVRDGVRRDVADRIQTLQSATGRRTPLGEKGRKGTVRGYRIIASK